MITLYAATTANGQKATIALEECGLDYELRHLKLYEQEHLSGDYLGLNPVGRIPTLVDDEQSFSVYGTLPIAYYLAERSGKLLPTGVNDRARVLDRATFITSDMAPAFAGHFIFSTIVKEKHPAVIEYYEQQVHRMVAVLEGYLGAAEFVAGADYTVADILAYPQAATSLARLDGAIDQYPNIKRWCERVGARPAVQRGMQACTPA